MQTLNGPDLLSGCAEPQAETTFLAPQQHPRINNAEANIDHNCICGDGCTCFGCPTHPKNRSTLDYVRYYSGIVDNDEITSVNSTDETPQPIRSQWHLDKIHEISAQCLSSTPDRTVAQDLAYRHLAPQQQSGAPNATTQIHFSIDQCRPTLESTELVCNGQEPESMAFDTDNSSSGKEISNMLDPMPFFVYQYTFSPCSNLVGTRQCGNDCSCPGCLTHSGDFSPLQPGSPTQPTFVGCVDHGTGSACQPFSTTAARAQGLQRPFQSTTPRQHRNHITLLACLLRPYPRLQRQSQDQVLSAAPSVPAPLVIKY